LSILSDEGHGARAREDQVLQYGYLLQFFDAPLK
jgi:dipeptidyl aminopeptidase/acylaminoacyl peptidase